MSHGFQIVRTPPTTLNDDDGNERKTMQAEPQRNFWAVFDGSPLDENDWFHLDDVSCLETT
ncbi:MAG: hypothetical protein GY822_23795 [Deltaproteobacteria bacterium]|nr:hypothetical protein [Deltaproteobacteria bacterium]